MTLAIAATVLLSALFCRIYLQVARVCNILDIPNERSSHSDATPRGGGIALMLAFALGLCLAALTTRAWSYDFLFLSAAAFALAVLGFIDDVRGLTMQLRLLAYSLVSLLASWFLLQPSSGGGVALLCLVALTILWSLNLYNFMDGIDGIAALQAVLACGGAAWLSARKPPD